VKLILPLLIDHKARHYFDSSNDILTRFDEMENGVGFCFVTAYVAVELGRGMETGLHGSCPVAVTMSLEGGLGSLI